MSTGEEILAILKKDRPLKWVLGDYVIYKRKYLEDNLEREVEFAKKHKEYRQKVENGEIEDPKKQLNKLREDIASGKII